MAQKITLYSPSGEKYETSSAVEATRLKALGYTDKAPKQASEKSSSDK